MSDDVDGWILHGAQVCIGVLGSSAAFYTGLMEAGNGIIQLLQKILVQIHITLKIHDVQFHPHQELHAVQGAGKDFKVNEMVIMGAAGHGRGMVGAAEDPYAPP